MCVRHQRVQPHPGWTGGREVDRGWGRETRGGENQEKELISCRSVGLLPVVCVRGGV